MKVGGRGGAARLERAEPVATVDGGDCRVRWWLGSSRLGRVVVRVYQMMRRLIVSHERSREAIGLSGNRSWRAAWVAGRGR